MRRVFQNILIAIAAAVFLVACSVDPIQIEDRSVGYGSAPPLESLSGPGALPNSDGTATEEIAALPDFGPADAEMDQDVLPSVDDGDAALSLFPQTVQATAEMSIEPLVEIEDLGQPVIEETEDLSPDNQGSNAPELENPEIAVLETETQDTATLEPEILEPEILEPEIPEPEFLEPETREPEIQETAIAESNDQEPDVEPVEATETVAPAGQDQSAARRPAPVPGPVPEPEPEIVAPENPTYILGLRKIHPVDKASEDEALLAFRDGLLAAVRDRDIEAVVAAADEGITLSFGGQEGRETFRALLTENREQFGITYWQELETVLALGGVFDQWGGFCTPYMQCIELPGCGENCDVHSLLVASGDQVTVYSARDVDALPVAFLAYDIVRIDDGFEHFPWFRVSLPGGLTGYVKFPDVRAPSSYRAFLNRRDGAWMLSGFIAGD